MGFNTFMYGFNESTLTSLAYVSYLLAFLFYSAYLISRASRTLRAPGARAALAGAEGGTAAGVTMAADEQARPASVLLGRIAVSVLGVAWLSLTAALVLRWAEAGHPPYVTLYEITTDLVWGTTTIYLALFEGVLRTRATGAFVVLLLFCLQSYAVWFIPADLKKSVQLVPALRSYWLVIHVSIAILSYSAFATAGGAGLAFVVRHYFRERLSSVLPSEAAIEEFMFRAVAVGFPLQTLLLITGAIWANEAWTQAWSWDPKEVWALVTWLTYAAYLHVRVQRGVRGITMAWLSLVGFIVVLVTFLGVNYLAQWFGIQSLHTYSVDNGAPSSMGWVGVGALAFLVLMLVVALFSWLRIKFPTRKARKEGLRSAARRKDRPTFP